MKTDLAEYTFGKLPPQARELEEAVLGACMIEKDAVIIAIGILKPNHFYVSAHGLVFSAIVRLFSRNEPVDILTVTEDLKKHGSLESVGGAYAVVQLTVNIASGVHVEYHARIVKQKWVQRERIRIASEQLKDAYEETSDALEGLGDSVTQFSDLLTEVASGALKSFSDTVTETFKQISEAASKSDDEKYVIGLTTGIRVLDHKTLGYNAPNLVLLAGRNSDGKTSLMLHSVLANAKRNVPVGIFSLEMSQEEIIQKLAGIETGIEVERIRSGRVSAKEWEQLGSAQEVLQGLPVYISDKGAIELTELSAIAKGWKAKYGVKIIFIDYLQLMEIQDKKITHEQKVSKISRGLKALAKELKTPVVAVAALSRNLETRSGWDKRPRDSDLREGGSLEYDADMIVFVFRPENHGLQTFEDGRPTANTVELNVSKNRLGGRGLVVQQIDNGTGKMSELTGYTVVKKTSIYEREETPF